MNKYLPRNKAYERRAPVKEAKKLYIISEGSDKEYSYFLYFRELSTCFEIWLYYHFYDCRPDAAGWKSMALSRLLSTAG